MKKRKLKAFVLPSIYISTIGAIVVGIGFMNTSLGQDTIKKDVNYSVSSIIENVEPVISETTESIMPTMPYEGEGVLISKDYYSKDDDEQVQQNSLIRYENTYLENTGILYNSENAFIVRASLDGTIVSISEDEFLGKVVEIKHTNNLSTYYYSLDEVNVKENDQIKAGDKIGTSGYNKIESEKPSLLFEVYYKGKALDPEAFYQTDISTYE